mmetsp:Transcript_91998/g.281533  ORF Transcript_91998/g.281533 Transcript_91998/m.281533 type:complete len:267 (+) Transcript_91998:186-986(+)
MKSPAKAQQPGSKAAYSWRTENNAGTDRTVSTEFVLAAALPTWNHFTQSAASDSQDPAETSSTAAQEPSVEREPMRWPAKSPWEYARYTSTPSFTKYTLSTAKPPWNTSCSVRYSCSRSAEWHKARMATAWFSCTWWKKGCRLRIGMYTSCSNSICSSSGRSRRSFTSRHAMRCWRAALVFSALRQMRVASCNETWFSRKKRRRWPSWASFSPVIFRRCVIAWVIEPIKVEKATKPTMMTTTVNERSAVFRGTTSMDAGVNCVMDQ